MLRARIRQDSIRIGKHFGLTFERTLRIPDDGGTYPLPPGLGSFPIRRVLDYEDRVPKSWRSRGGVFIPMYQREAMWIMFDAPHWRPCAVKIAVGKVNAISGETWRDDLCAEPQDYVVCPVQPWLDGIKAGEGFIRQFVAMPLGMGYTVEGQVTGKEEFGGLQIMAFDPKPGRFPNRPPRGEYGMRGMAEGLVCCCAAPGTEMGLGAGGKMRQKIYADEYGIETWDGTNTGRVYVHIANSMMWREITGEEPPETPVSARTYASYGLPWFDLYDEGKGDLKAGETLAGIKSVKEMDHTKGFSPQQDDEPVDIPEGSVTILGQTEADIPIYGGKW